ncbi:ABC transporter substrate-binding protein [Chitinophaga sp. SYP-B3965]|uniref:ABC transporter substrate-binding protein n=1 Tax=Chitinophaga sp. SYP-B3965 TaxID=2663120 RepID=UPI001564F535|nr:ABC transporter substrate-binding protein [Chitinophaga sp. SYP-B3965]
MKIGFLIPYSGVFPSLKEDFLQGFLLAFPRGWEERLSFLYEFIQMGDLKKVQDALQKLIMFDRVNVVVGIVSNNVIAQCTDIYVPRKIPVLINNLGARIPDQHFSNPFLFYNSLHLWKSQWSMGHWAQQQFGGTPSINMALYESGYSLHECFKLGTAASGAEQVHLNILKYTPGNVDATPLVDYLLAQKPAHAHVLLSGKEAHHFLEQYHAAGCSANLSVSPFMADATLMPDMSLLENTHHATTWSVDLPADENKKFVDNYRDGYQETPTVFSMLGYESGLMVAEEMQVKQVKGPRGDVNFSTEPLSALLPVYIRKTVKRNGQIIHEQISKEPGISWSDEALIRGSGMEASGWQNPYLCV